MDGDRDLPIRTFKIREKFSQDCKFVVSTIPTGKGGHRQPGWEREA